MKYSLIVFVAVSLTIECGKDSTENQSAMDDCHLLQSLEKLDDLLDECQENKFNSVSEIEDNLIGNWSLSAIIPAWVAFEAISECLILSISQNYLTLKNFDTGEQSSSAWELEFFEVIGYSVFYLEPEVEDLRWSVGMHFFSKNIMYGSGFADDTDAYVYVKL
jgi:hypothetical protein